VSEQGRGPTGHPLPPPSQTPRLPAGRFVHRVEEEIRVTSPTDVANYLKRRVFCPFADFDQEELWVLLMTIKNQVTHQVMVYRGPVRGINVRVAEVFKEAVRHNAPAIIVTHCHPSGDPGPSAEDINVTRQLVEAGRLLDIEVLDHLIIGDPGYTSLRERGLGGVS